MTVATLLSSLISPVFLQLQDGSAEFLLEVAALLHGQRVRLLGEGLSDLGQVAVVVDLVSVERGSRVSRCFKRAKIFCPHILNSCSWTDEILKFGNFQNAVQLISVLVGLGISCTTTRKSTSLRIASVTAPDPTCTVKNS